MRLVTIDGGNTNQSVAFHNENGLAQIIELKDFKQEKDDFILISNVGPTLSFKPDYDLKAKRTSTAFFDMPVDYALTLGEDRLIAAYGVFKKKPKHIKVLLIDAGTFITCDLISDAGFQGGYIFPGIERFLKSYADSAQLPLLEVKDFQNFPNNKKIPHETNEAILMASSLYLESIIEGTIKKHSPDKIIITGGSAQDIGKLISSKVHFELVHHLVHSALRLIHDLHIQSNP